MSTTQHAAPDVKAGHDLAAKLFRGFADPSRLALLEALREGERCVSELVVATGLTQSNVSGHLACLRDCGLVLSRQEGRFVYYRLADPRVAEVLGNAHAIVALFAARIAACANYGRDGRTPQEDAAP
jgi:ArsR family transcriptional regulator, cadmium/lead-responsive transcriptional repressor